MASSAEYVKSHPEIGNLTPLPASLHSGLVAISIFALLSFILTSSLFLYLTFKLVTWHLRKKSQAKSITRNIPEPQPVTDFTFEDGAFGPDGEFNKVAHDRNVQRIRAAKNKPPNQFLILIYNLIIADMHQGTAFLLSVAWIRKQGLFIDAPTCFVQGFFDSNGDLSSSLFITAIAIHTYLSVVKGYRPPQNVLYAGTIGIWVFVYCLSVIPLLATRNGRAVGGFFVRAGPWCWINEGYQDLRLFTHYIFIFLSLVSTTTLYITIYWSLRKQAQREPEKPGENESQVKTSHNPAFLIYALIYVTCTLPLAVGRIATMAGAEVPLGYYCFAGTLIASNGSFDCLLFGTTRHSIVFSSTDDIDVEDTGLETFAFMRTPEGRFGNKVWIQGGQPRPKGNGVGGWWVLGEWNCADAGMSQARMRTNSQESLQSGKENDMAIQMDVITSMTIETERNKERDLRFPDPARSEAPSITGHEQATRRVV
ncbi:G protein-coupled glucose receptor regulating Gpa2-domain-containing protein [Mariannaea sp. PMI_226]|nr:G protein-coupled glucose receptor regulating Gpa2-domain-containing protein [Mariannaea sp. PMI_226]